MAWRMACACTAWSSMGVALLGDRISWDWLSPVDRADGRVPGVDDIRSLPGSRKGLLDHIFHSSTGLAWSLCTIRTTGRWAVAGAVNHRRPGCVMRCDP